MPDKFNKLTPGSNLLWESSRMMLPEHKEEILRQNRSKQRRERPVLDEQKREEIESVLRDSLQNRTVIELVLFAAFGLDRTLRGKVTWIDRVQVKVTSAEGGTEWVETADIVDVHGPMRFELD